MEYIPAIAWLFICAACGVELIYCIADGERRVMNDITLILLMCTTLFWIIYGATEARICILQGSIFNMVLLMGIAIYKKHDKNAER